MLSKYEWNDYCQEPDYVCPRVGEPKIQMHSDIAHNISFKDSLDNRGFF